MKLSLNYIKILYFKISFKLIFKNFVYKSPIQTNDMTDYLPGTAGLIEDIDKKHLVVLRDGRTLIGILRAIDQFANLVLHQTVERIHVDGFFGDIPRGIFVVRGTEDSIHRIFLKKFSNFLIRGVILRKLLLRTFCSKHF